MIIIPEMEIRDLIDLFPRYADKRVNTSGESFFLNGEQFMLCKTFDIHSALVLRRRGKNTAEIFSWQTHGLKKKYAF